MKDKKKIGRREFLKVAGTGAAVTTAALYGCKPRSAGSASEADGARQGQMTYRTNPKTGERVSLLGYDCMRWPTVSGSDDIDQEMVNALVDHAIAHGVNYFDTSPAYCRGHSEHATGVALSRHPRDKYFIATKLSNFAPSTWSREASMAMYRNSFRELQVDYIDYLLLHGVGMGSGMEEFEARYIDNGMLDFLLAEREAGRIRNLGFSYHGDIAVFDHLLAQHDRYKWDFVQIQLNYVDWKHAKEVNTRNTDAEYLYGELEKRGIPTVIMEPLLGGRLSNVHDHIAAHLKQRRPSSSVASWAFRFAGSFPGVLTVLSGMTYMEHLQDNLRTYSPLDELTDDDKEFLEQTAQLMLRYPTIPCTITSVSTKGMSPPRRRTKITAGRAGRSSWATTAASPNSARPAIASAVTSACRIARRISVSRRNCIASTCSPNISNRITYRPSGPAASTACGALFSAALRLRAPCIRDSCGMPRTVFCRGFRSEAPGDGGSARRRMSSRHLSGACGAGLCGPEQEARCRAFQ